MCGWVGDGECILLVFGCGGGCVDGCEGGYCGVYVVVK